MVRRKWPLALSVACLVGCVLYQASFTSKGTALATPTAMKTHVDRSKVAVPGKASSSCEEEVVQAVGVSLFVILAMPQSLEKAVNFDAAFLLIVAPVIVHLIWQLFKFWKSMLRQVMQRPTIHVRKHTLLLAPELEASNAHVARFSSTELV
mmetsp:Transcript_71812/g.134289  ORF Transcript_71812/g.134289 Transcript_71812/m.134289 type:complete len:151 (+) Transcript_71812:83-535(+)